MSVTYRIVKRPAGEAEGKEMGRGTVAALRDVLENVPVILVTRRNPSLVPRVYVYEVQVWSEAAQDWMWHMPLIPWTHASASISLGRCFINTDVPLADEDDTEPQVFTSSSIPLSGVDFDLPRIITPAVTYI